MTFFFYYQKSGGEEAWQPALADTRAQVIAKQQPRFVTVLDVNGAIDETYTRQQIDELKYRGDLYFDFDSQDLGEALDKFRTLLGKLVDLDVDPHQLRLYATGGRGFHIEAPSELFMPKAAKHGVPRLPLIYKEMAYELFVDTLDLRVYSARKGRMWRTPNVKRENGRYKVPITPREAMEMSVDDYAVLCATPREAPPIAPPELSNKFAVLYEKAAAKIDAASKRKKTTKQDGELLNKFKGQYPPSLLRVMAGEVVAENIGFHKIALQIVITTHALGKNEEQMLAACEGLMLNHKSDGQRYNTPTKRKAELQRMFRYTEGNICYEYRRDAVRSLLPKGTASPDLDGLTDEITGAILDTGATGNSEGLLGGLFVTEKGIFKRNEVGAQMVSEISYRDVHLLVQAVGGAALGFEAEVLQHGALLGRRMIRLDAFLSKSAYVKFCMIELHAGGFRGSDNDVQSVAAILRDTAMQNKKIVYVTNREGLDLIQRPDSKEKQLDFVWVSPVGIVTQSPATYMLRSATNDEAGLYKSDLLLAPDLVADEETAAVIDALLNFNEPYVVANLLGWFTGAFHRQVYHRSRFGKFPILQVFGQSGAGKTTTMGVMLRLFYYLAEPQLPHVSSVTQYAAHAMLLGSASMPILFDEYKPRQMRDKIDGFRKMFAGAFNAATLAKGSMSTEMNASWKNISQFRLCAPTGFIGEAMEAETALLERSVCVPLSKESLNGRRQYERLLTTRPDVISSLGREIVNMSFGITIDGFVAGVECNIERAAKVAFRNDNDRVVFNLAVVLTGLDFMSQVIRRHFGNRFDAQFDKLRGAALDTTRHVSLSVMAEAAKVLNILAHMSRDDEAMPEHKLKFGVDYSILADSALDLQMRNCYYKYLSWSRRKGQQPLYDNEEAFVQGLANYAPLRSKSNMDSVLKVTGMERIFRFDGAKLKTEGVEPFKA